MLRLEDIEAPDEQQSMLRIADGKQSKGGRVARLATTRPPRSFSSWKGGWLEVEIVRIEQGRALAAVATEHRPWLVRRLALVVGDATEAEDLAQQVLLRAAERWPLPAGSNVRAWLAVVGIRLAIDERRRRQRWGFLPIRETDQEWAMTTDPDLWRAMAALDRRTRAALVLTVLDGYTQDEVAEMLAVPRGTVASWLSRGKARLRDVLNAEVT